MITSNSFAEAPSCGRAAFCSLTEIDRKLRESAVRREIIPIECRSSWLVPITAENSAEGRTDLYLTGFLYAVAGIAGQPKSVGRPAFQWTIDPRTCRIVEVLDCRYRDFAAQVPGQGEVGILTPDLLPAQTAPELEKFRAELLQAYDRVLPFAFVPTERLKGEEQGSIRHFRQLLQRGTEPFLVPFYRALNPAFFEWLYEF